MTFTLQGWYATACLQIGIYQRHACRSATPNAITGIEDAVMGWDLTKDGAGPETAAAAQVYMVLGADLSTLKMASMLGRAAGEESQQRETRSATARGQSCGTLHWQMRHRQSLPAFLVSLQDAFAGEAHAKNLHMCKASKQGKPSNTYGTS